MQSFRIGKTLKIRWAILSGGAPEPLAGRDLTLEISSGNRVRTILPFVADGNVAVFYYQGRDQRFTGSYTVTMWENYAKEGQTVVDRCDAFALVPSSCEETRTAASDIGEGELEIEPAELEIGVPGMSAYELYIKHNPDSELTEEEYAEAPVQAAGVALAMIEQLEETDAAVKQAEQLREQAEQGREASEQARATAEQGRVTAEQQRVLAEQTRVTNESSRQTAETGRQAAETKREENTSEAIRNCESATQKAEEEAARVRTLADNPPKIVEVDGVRYWASWNEATGQYVVSENRADVGDAVLFSAQELNTEQRAQVQTNIGVKSAVDVVGAGEITTAELVDVAEADKFRTTSGGIGSSIGYYYSKPFLAKRGDIIMGTMKGSGSTSLISEVTSGGNFISSLLVGISVMQNVFFVITRDMYLSIASYKPNTQLQRVSCKLAGLLAEPAGGYNRKEYESIGAVWNDAKGKWVHDRLEMTEAEMLEVWKYGIVKNINYCNNFLLSRKGVKKILFDITWPIPHVDNNMDYFARQSDIEQVSIRGNYGYVKVVGRAYYLFYSCPKLKEINVVLDVEKATQLESSFVADPSLVTVKLKSLKMSISFKDSPLLTVDDTVDSSLGYLVENATNTGPITITLHPDAYAKVPQTLIEKAAAKQISIASA